MRTDRVVIYVNRKQLLKIIPLSERTIYNMEKRGEFPKRIYLTSRSVVWNLDEIYKWIRGKQNSTANTAQSKFFLG
jgi:prophage regulatory protein